VLASTPNTVSTVGINQLDTAVFRFCVGSGLVALACPGSSAHGH
jgi:hypothetical protein